jgi:hypothetical protein
MCPLADHSKKNFINYHETASGVFMTQSGVSQAYFHLEIVESIYICYSTRPFAVKQSMGGLNKTVMIATG